MYEKDRNPGAFMSYVHKDDDDGRISAFRNKLSSQTRKVIGEEFPIFQDCEDIKWGQEWKAQIDESLAEVTFFIPIITPSFFKSQYCRDELTRFLEREKKLGLKLILPVYYIETPLIEDKSRRYTDELSKIICSRQFEDCRVLLFEDLDSQKIRTLMFTLAIKIREALEGLSPKATDSPIVASSNIKAADFSEDYKTGFYNAAVLVGQAKGMGGSLEQLYMALGGRSTPETAEIVSDYNKQTTKFNQQIVPYVNSVISQIFGPDDNRPQDLCLSEIPYITHPKPRMTPKK